MDLSTEEDVKEDEKEEIEEAYDFQPSIRESIDVPYIQHLDENYEAGSDGTSSPIKTNKSPRFHLADNFPTFHKMHTRHKIVSPESKKSSLTKNRQVKM